MNLEILSQYIRSVSLDREKIKDNTIYPFCLDVIKNLSEIDFHPQVTYLIGENGSGKSTLLEAIAIAYGLNAEGGSKNLQFSSRTTHSDLHDYIKMVKGIRLPKNSYFLRAESFYNVATHIDELDEAPAFGPPIIDSYGGKSLHQQSHGESFLSLLLNHFSGEGIYILDEPEAALSPKNQLTFLIRLKELADEGSQFIIATHSPIIMGYPHAKILEVSTDGYSEISYEDSHHYAVFKQFMNNRDEMLKDLFKE